jgi:hypothetical protein
MAQVSGTTPARSIAMRSVRGKVAPRPPLRCLAGAPLLARHEPENSRLALLDAESGTVKARLEISGDADDVSVHPKRQRRYVSCGSGSIDTFIAEGSSYRFTARIGTVRGARTSLFGA